MNDSQKVAFDLLRQFVAICEKWDIPYYLVCGSALGAVKYQGFIPWDDDIDVGLLRPDYQRFLEVAPSELTDGYFLQNYKTQPLFYQTWSKLRNSNTTFIESDVANLPINHGIYIDIFPIDGQPQGKWEKRWFFLCHKLCAWVRFSVLEDSPQRKVRIRNKLLRGLGSQKWISAVQRRIEKLNSKYPPETSRLWCNYGNWQGQLEYAPRWHYGEGVWANFEGLRVRIPENYDAYLTQKYGDWRSDPPKEKQQTHHRVVVCDAHKPYTYYTKSER